MKKSLLLLPMLIPSFVGVACAYANTDDNPIEKTLKKMDIQAIDIQPSQIAGLNTVLTKEGVFYISTDGKRLFQGPLYDVSGKEPINITNQLLMKKLISFENEMILYKAQREKHVVTVFTDITCGYCHKLHGQMKKYNDLGITIRYLAFPRQGLNAKAAKDMESIWCMADRQRAFDAAIKGEEISPASCKIDIKKHYELGVQLGIQGTPSIVLQNGVILPGYLAPEELNKKLDEISSSSKNNGQ
ncbi:bifunctional protein-disulfide isomerase/oxidoreductase DsbC [Candidatus Fukatsuia symbiotica]|uniref:Thiol:disulfide interchange protein n=1 Tax=Candidatus Fukatsuia symbiotica TaxID=1878942 RepID=A0A2U8I4G6_9GAMM|nr:bifunctional protein-disulfide isomerase/oxidoreductase DsbC [Candidatus Fukatsuia symbiotica]AWK14046.1 bifunctional protein-disulfide isomerase/oxidoreductase DsbC [Candidatus Fukatsuia symbiotica]MEA9445594.1 bifunctional protein-disulfide isomerase/oxidoreductase DsbC [Candidatus Fukatsuia symbiotica]